MQLAGVADRGHAATGQRRAGRRSEQRDHARRPRLRERPDRLAQPRATDSNHQLAASFHTYNFNVCNMVSCWNSQDLPVAAQAPLITGELGENDCGHGFIDSYMAWADSYRVSYLGWTWDSWSCSGGPALITSYSGTPSGFAIGFRDHLLKIN